MEIKLNTVLKVEQIDFRAGFKAGDWTCILAYKDARVDMERLDECVGPLNWQRRHEDIKGTLHCHVGIRNTETNEWVWKSDAGVPSKTEAEKGEASDSFKRACTNWGIGRELYDMGWLWTKADCSQIKRWQWKGTYADANDDYVIDTLTASLRGKEIARFKRWA